MRGFSKYIISHSAKIPEEITEGFKLQLFGAEKAGTFHDFKITPEEKSKIKHWPDGEMAQRTYSIFKSQLKNELFKFNTHQGAIKFIHYESPWPPSLWVHEGR